MHSARSCNILDEESSLQRCLDAYLNARRQKIDVRSVKCKNCKNDLVDFDFKNILSNTRVCPNCNV